MSFRTTGRNTINLDEAMGDGTFVPAKEAMSHVRGECKHHVVFIFYSDANDSNRKRCDENVRKTY